MAATTGPPPSARPGRTRRPYRRSRSAGTSASIRRRPTPRVPTTRSSGLPMTGLRPADHSRRAAAPSRSCSVTGPLGRRDLRVTNDRHFYQDGGEQLWRIEPGQSPRPYTAADGWQTRALGDGHRKPGSHRRPLSGGLPHEPGRQQAPDPGRWARARPDQDLALDRGVTAHRPFAGDTSSFPRPGTPSSRTSTTMATWTCSSARATSGRRSPTTPCATPATSFIGQAHGMFVEGARGGRDGCASTSPEGRTWSI